MILIKRGQAVEVSTWPPSRVVHACWLNDATSRFDYGHGNIGEEPAIVTACGVWADPEDVHETDAPIDCITCLVRHERFAREIDEDSPD